MGVLQYPRAWAGTKPPPGVQLNTGHPLATALVGAWLFNEGAGPSTRNLVAPVGVGTLTNGPSWSPQGGGGLSFAVASDQSVNAGNPAALQITGSITVATHYRLRTGPPTNGYMLVAKDKDTGGRAYTLDVSPTVAWGARFYINGGSGDGTTNIALEGVTAAAGDERAVAGVYDVSIPLVRLYVNGVAKNTSVATDASIPTATANVLFGRREYSGFEAPLDGWLRYVYIWQRALKPAEIAQVAADPYVLVVPPRRRLWTQVAAVAATTVQRRTSITMGTRVGSRQAS